MYLNETQRRYVYGIAIAAAPLLVAANILTTEAAALWLTPIAATLLLGSSVLAASNVGAEPEAYVGKRRAD